MAELLGFRLLQRPSALEHICFRKGSDAGRRRLGLLTMGQYIVECKDCVSIAIEKNRIVENDG